LGNNYIALRDNDSANKEHALAKADYEAYVSLKKDNASCYNWLGLEYAYTKDWQKAIDTYNKALELNPSSNGGEYFHNRAVAKRGMNDIAGARADAQTALSKGWKQAGALLDLMK
jgi:lipoprotein NlpI